MHKELNYAGAHAVLQYAHTLQHVSYCNDVSSIRIDGHLVDEALLGRSGRAFQESDPLQT